MTASEMFNYRLSWKQLVVYLGIGVSLILLMLSENWALVLWLLVVAMLGQLVYVAVLHKRLPPGRREIMHETVQLPWSCEVVWALIKPAENSSLLDVNVRRGYKVPGTPDGLGERQAFEQHDGWTVIVEVVEYQPGRRAVTRRVSPPLDQWFRSIQAVDPIEGGCEYTTGLEVELGVGRRMDPHLEKLWRSGVREQMSRLQQTLAAADQGPVSAGSLSADQASVWPSPEPPAQS